MNYPLSLSSAFYLAGFFLLFLGSVALGRPEATTKWLRAFPRSHAWGIGLLILATAWFWLLVKLIDLGEFGKWKSYLLIVTPVAAILTGKYVAELLSVRALGMVLLLAAEPLLEAAFLQPEVSRLLLVVLAYAAIVFAMFWIGKPYLLRDQIGWLVGGQGRFRLVAGATAGYGVLLLISGLTLRR